MTFIVGMLTGAVAMLFLLAFVGSIEFDTTYYVVKDDSDEG